MFKICNFRRLPVWVAATLVACGGGDDRSAETTAETANATSADTQGVKTINSTASASADGRAAAADDGAAAPTGFTLAAAQDLGRDSDGDGIPDLADNCINVRNPNQRDTNADGIGNACDADLDNNGRVDFADLALLRQAFLTRVGDRAHNPHADLNGDGLVNFADLAILRASMFRAPGPAGQNAVPDPYLEMPRIQINLSSQPLCADDRTHLVQLNWQLAPLADRPALTFTVFGPDGESLTRQASAATGGLTLTLNAPRGGPATVAAEAQVVGRAPARQTMSLALTPCVGNPAPVPPNLGFVPPPVVEPPVIGVPGGRPREVDIVHLGGSPNGPTPARVVVAAGTGAGVRLFSFEQPADRAPDLLAQSEAFAGRHVKLLTLAPEVSPKLVPVPFVAAVLRDDENLWLAAWQTFADGRLQRFGQAGYGANVNVRVLAHAMSYRVLPNGNFQVVSAIRHIPRPLTPSEPTPAPRLRLVSWEVARDDGQVTGRADTGNWGTPDDGGELSVLHLREGLYVVHYRNASGNLNSHYWQVAANGVATDGTGSSTGFDHFGGFGVQHSASHVVALPLIGDDMVVPLLSGGGDFTVNTWETRPLFAGGFGFNYRPFLISRDTDDLDPSALGVQLTPPALTDATDSDTNALLARVRARLTDGSLEQRFGVGQGRLFEDMPQGELTSVHMASVTKNMVLLLAVEAIGRGEASLDDLVTVSEAAANVGGSQMGPNRDDASDDLQVGEVQSLNTLLHGMMLRSGNDAAAAIAEHLAGPGNFAAFVARMNERAWQLGLTQTLYGETDPSAGAPAGGGISTPQDQITLLRAGNQLPLFAQIASVRSYTGCGTTAQGFARCYELAKLGDSGYPGLESWKGGNGGFWIDPDFNDYSANGGPYCVGSGCLVAQATRMERPMFVGLQQSGNRWAAADAMFSYGYRRQFTPDRRGPLRQVLTNVTDFALDNVSDTLGITVDLRTGVDEFNVCAWSMLADGGFLDALPCRSVAMNDIPGNNTTLPRAMLDGTRISTLQADGDYLIGHRVVNNLYLTLWRVGTRER